MVVKSRRSAYEVKKAGARQHGGQSQEADAAVIEPCQLADQLAPAGGDQERQHPLDDQHQAQGYGQVTPHATTRLSSIGKRPYGAQKSRAARSTGDEAARPGSASHG